MRVSLSGFGRHADTLHVEIPRSQQITWQNITGILNIPGVSYYYIQGAGVGVRYSKVVEAEDVAAQTLRILASALGISTEELVITIDEFLMNDDEAFAVADNIRLRIRNVATPEHVLIHHVEPRGSGPAYWLR